jgi:transcriptional regulator with XRE-family HTH domain
VPPVAERFAENLSRYREQSGLSVEALASKAETHRTQVSQYLNAKAMPRLDVVVRLAGSLNVSVAQLVEGVTWEPAADTGHYKTEKRAK